MKEKIKKPKIRFDKFTDDWQPCWLGEIADIVGGGTPSTNIAEYWDGNIDWYAPAEIADQIFIESSQRKITQDGYNHSSATMLPEGTVLFTSRAGIGKTAILAKEGCTNQGFQSIVPHKDVLDSYFIFSRTGELKKYGETKGAGSTFVEVSGKQMAEMEIMMPLTLTEQQMIGHFFKFIDYLIALNQRKYTQLVNIKKAMLKKMFPQNGTAMPAMRFTGFAGIWDQCRIGDILTIKDSARIPNSLWKDRGIRYLRSSDLKNPARSSLFISDETFNMYRMQTGAPESGDVLFASGGDIGLSYYYKGKNPIYVQGGAVLYIKTSHSEIIDGRYLKVYLESPIVHQYIESASAGGTIKHFTLAPANNTPLYYPNLFEQQKIANFFFTLDNVISLYQLKLEKLHNIKDACLKKMFVHSQLKF